MAGGPIPLITRGCLELGGQKMGFWGWVGVGVNHNVNTNERGRVQLITRGSAGRMQLITRGCGVVSHNN